MYRIALVVGHSPKSQGAKSYDGLSEWAWHIDMLSYLQWAHNNVEIVTIWRNPYFSYKTGTDALVAKYFQKDFIKFDLAIELHFNAFDGKTPIERSEVIVGNKEEASLVAELFSDRMAKYYGTKTRKVSVNDVSRGKYAINSFEAVGIPSVILEPCFGDTENKLSKQVLTDPAKYADLLSEVILEFTEN